MEESYKRETIQNRWIHFLSMLQQMKNTNNETTNGWEVIVVDFLLFSTAEKNSTIANQHRRHYFGATKNSPRESEKPSNSNRQS